MKLKSFIKIIALSAVFAAFFGILAMAEDSQVIEMKDVPEVVRNAFNSDYPDFNTRVIEREVSKGTTYYEFEAKDGRYEKAAIYIEDGTFYAFEEEIPVDQLPSVVTNSIIRAYPNGEIDEAEKISRKSTTDFEVVVEVDDGQNEIEYEIIVSADGKIKSVEQSDEEDDD